MSSIIPNTTQIPHIIIREWMPRLKDVELRVLLVVADQTLGWLEDPETGRRKERDWISHYQLRQKTGRSDRGVSLAVRALVDVYRIVEAYSEAGERLDSPYKRAKLGSRIYYRLNLHHPEKGLFDTPVKNAGDVYRLGKSPPPPQILRPQNLRATKETFYTKRNTGLQKVDKYLEPWKRK